MNIVKAVSAVAHGDSGSDLEARIEKEQLGEVGA
jgi:hypothetical protein